MEKTCFKCREVKPINEFYLNRSMADGHLNKCKKCSIEDAKKNRQNWTAKQAEESRRRRRIGYIPQKKQRKIRKFSIELYKRWVGTSADYRNLHSWVERRLGKPSVCEWCGRSGLSGRRIHWANKSGEYKKALSDWERLCAACHYRKDAQGLTRTSTSSL